MTWNARHGAGAVAQPFAEQILRFDPDTAIITDFPNNNDGQTIKDILTSGGLSHYSGVDTPTRENSVLIASKLPFSSIQGRRVTDITGTEGHWGHGMTDNYKNTCLFSAWIRAQSKISYYILKKGVDNSLPTW